MLRKLLLILPTLIVVLGAANVLVLVAGWQADEPPAEPRTAWQRWKAMPGEERTELVRGFEAIDRRPDAWTIWRALREFARLDPGQQRRLRELYQVQREVIAAQNPTRRAALLRAEPGERAFFVYAALERNDPERLERLAQQPAGTPDASP